MAMLSAATCVAAAIPATPALAAAPAWSPVAASGPTNLPPLQSETQRLGVDAEGGTFTLTFETQTTGAIPFDAEPGTVESELNALPSIAGSTSVAGGPGGPDAEHPYLVTFAGSLANTNVAPVTADASSLTGSGQTATVITTVPGGPGTGQIAIYAQNVGGLSSSGKIEVEVTLPTGVKTSASPEGPAFPFTWTCSPGAGQQSFTCESNRVVPPGSASFPIKAPVTTDASASGTKPVEVTVEGGGAEPASYSLPLTVSSTPAEPGVQTFTAGAYDADGELDTRAGGHPYSGSTAILVNTFRNSHGIVVPAGEFKDIEVDLPPGFLGNPIATPECPENDLPVCEADTIVGVAGPILGFFGSADQKAAVYDVQAPFGYPGKFFFEVAGVPIHAVGALRSDGDYGLTVGSINTAQLATVYGSFFTFWGAPADPAHDIQRCKLGVFGGSGLCPAPVPSTAPKTAFLSSPTDCAREAVEPPIARLRVTLWQSPSITHIADVAVPPVTECENLHFDADFTFEPDLAKSDSPASFRTELSVPSEGLTDPDKLMTPTIRESVVELPKGVVLNASAADGLGACSKEQIGLKGTNFPAPNHIRFTKDPQTCPDSSKIGSGELKSELLADPLHGALYLAAQGDGNPFGSLFAIYLVIEDPRHGIFIKLPGEVHVNKGDGQQRIVFRDLPQLPFTYLRLNLKGGSRSPLASPMTCGSFITTATNTPWSYPESGPPTTSANGFEINQGPDGGPCAPTLAARPFDVGLNAGADSVQAGAFTSLTFQITRPDGSQEIDTLRLDLPAGLAASLKGVPYCSEAQIAAAISRGSGKDEQANPSCPAASQVGRTLAGAGSGPTPFYAPGRLYLAGPYKGAPLSVVAITPAVAGPFDLGNVVIRNAISVDPVTAQVSAISDPIPQIVEGVPLRVKDIRVILDRPGFGLNPTDCTEKQIGATVTGNSGATANLATRFQVGNCAALGFKPKTRLQLFGGVKRGKYQGVRAVVRPRPGDSNISRTVVRFPRSAFVAQEHIRTVCTRVQFAAEACPKGSIYGRAIAYSPLLDEPLQGNVYLRSSDNELPDAVADLRGPARQPIRIEVAVRNDSVKGALRNTVLAAPDAPVSYFRLQIFGGRKGLIVNSRNICKGRNNARVAMKAHNGRRSVERVNVFNKRCKKQRRAKRKARRAAPRRRG